MRTSVASIAKRVCLLVTRLSSQLLYICVQMYIFIYVFEILMLINLKRHSLPQCAVMLRVCKLLEIQARMPRATSQTMDVSLSRTVLPANVEVCITKNPLLFYFIYKACKYSSLTFVHIYNLYMYKFYVFSKY